MFFYKNRYSGFSLLELVISISLLALIILYVIATFTKMLQSSTKGVDLTIGNFVAQSKLDVISQNIKNYTSFVGTPQGPFTQYIYASNSSTPTKFIFRYGIYSLYDAPSGSLYKVDIVVKWWKSTADFNSSDVRKGYGLLVTKLSRLVYSSSY